MDEATIRRAFHTAAAALQSDELGVEAFMTLTKACLADDLPGKSPPSAKDLQCAFTLADADESGLVDEEEFLVIYRLALAGEVHGLAGKKTMFGSSSNKAKNRERQESFKRQVSSPPATATADAPQTWPS